MAEDRGIWLRQLLLAFQWHISAEAQRFPDHGSISLPALLQRFWTSGKTYYAGEYEYKCAWVVGDIIIWAQHDQNHDLCEVYQ